MKDLVVECWDAEDVVGWRLVNDDYFLVACYELVLNEEDEVAADETNEYSGVGWKIQMFALTNDLSLM